jgi:hypothetical protein
VGPWIGGAWLTIDGQRVGLALQDLPASATSSPSVGRARGGVSARPSARVRLGDLPREIDCCVPLADREELLPALKALVRPYPPLLLQAALVQRFLFEADFSLDGAAKGAARGDVVYVAAVRIGRSRRWYRFSTP